MCSLRHFNKITQNAKNESLPISGGQNVKGQERHFGLYGQKIKVPVVEIPWFRRLKSYASDLGILVYARESSSDLKGPKVV